MSYYNRDSFSAVFQMWYYKSYQFSMRVCLITQSCPSLWDPMDYSPPGSSVLGDSPRQEHWRGLPFLFQGIFPIQGLNPGLPHCRGILYCLSHQGSPPIPYKILEKVSKENQKTQRQCGFYEAGSGGVTLWNIYRNSSLSLLFGRHCLSSLFKRAIMRFMILPGVLKACEIFITLTLSLWRGSAGTD